MKHFLSSLRVLGLLFLSIFLFNNASLATILCREVNARDPQFVIKTQEANSNWKSLALSAMPELGPPGSLSSPLEGLLKQLDLLAETVKDQLRHDEDQLALPNGEREEQDPRFSKKRQYLRHFSRQNPVDARLEIDIHHRQIQANLLRKLRKDLVSAIDMARYLSVRIRLPEYENRAVRWAYESYASIVSQILATDFALEKYQEDTNRRTKTFIEFRDLGHRIFGDEDAQMRLSVSHRISKASEHMSALRDYLSALSIDLRNPLVSDFGIEARKLVLTKLMSQIGLEMDHKFVVEVLNFSLVSGVPITTALEHLHSLVQEFQRHFKDPRREIGDSVLTFIAISCLEKNASPTDAVRGYLKIKQTEKEQPPEVIALLLDTSFALDMNDLEPVLQTFRIISSKPLKTVTPRGHLREGEKIRGVLAVLLTALKLKHPDLSVDDVLQSYGRAYFLGAQVDEGHHIDHDALLLLMDQVIGSPSSDDLITKYFAMRDAAIAKNSYLKSEPLALLTLLQQQFSLEASDVIGLYLRTGKLDHGNLDYWHFRPFRIVTAMSYALNTKGSVQQITDADLATALDIPGFSTALPPITLLRPQPLQSSSEHDRSGQSGPGILETVIVLGALSGGPGGSSGAFGSN